jgi:hypothetical protein
MHTAALRQLIVRHAKACLRYQWCTTLTIEAGLQSDTVCMRATLVMIAAAEQRHAVLLARVIGCCNDKCNTTLL